MAIALAQSKVHSYVSKLLRTDKDDEEEFLSHSLNPPYNKYAPMCTVMFMDVVDFTALSGQVDSQVSAHWAGQLDPQMSAC